MLIFFGPSRWYDDTYEMWNPSTTASTQILSRVYPWMIFQFYRKKVTSLHMNVCRAWWMKPS